MLVIQTLTTISYRRSLLIKQYGGKTIKNGSSISRLKSVTKNISRGKRWNIGKTFLLTRDILKYLKSVHTSSISTIFARNLSVKLSSARTQVDRRKNYSIKLADTWNCHVLERRFCNGGTSYYLFRLVINVF